MHVFEIDGDFNRVHYFDFLMTDSEYEHPYFSYDGRSFTSVP